MGASGSAFGCWPAALAAALTLAGCASAPPPSALACAAPEATPVRLSADGRTASRKIDVLTYNIEGLGPPARWGRGPELAEIGRHLAALRAMGEAPDIILFQEVFSDAATEAVRAAGYPSRTSGPGRSRKRELPSAGRVSGPRQWSRGELGLRLAGGGLTIVSRYPIVQRRSEPFGHRACAGLDCLSNKGALMAEIAIPGAPDPLQVFDSHLNSGRHARVPIPRTREAHRLQAQELAGFLEATRNPSYPSLLAGDFNMRQSPQRFAALEVLAPMTLVHRYCLGEAGRCEVHAAWSGATPWMDTQDLQYFQSGARVGVRPVRVQTMFDGQAGPKLSDHKGLRVTYELSWPIEETMPVAKAMCAATRP